MATIQEQQIEVAADPTLVRSSWGRFIEWARTGPSRLACDEIACVDAVRAGRVDFQPTASGSTSVVFLVVDTLGGSSPEELRRQLSHDLVVFKDYVERSGLGVRKPNDTEEAAHEVEAVRRGDKPRHVRLSSENDTTFMRSHFPT